jgi:hypothetical protein
MLKQPSSREEKAITGGVDPQNGTIVAYFVPEDRLALGGGFANVESDDHIFAIEDDEGQRWLALVVVEQEIVGGGGVTPRFADGTATEDVPGISGCKPVYLLSFWVQS